MLFVQYSKKVKNALHPNMTFVSYILRGTIKMLSTSLDGHTFSKVSVIFFNNKSKLSARAKMLLHVV
jgi:hypothetical protein